MRNIDFGLLFKRSARIAGYALVWGVIGAFLAATVAVWLVAFRPRFALVGDVIGSLFGGLVFSQIGDCRRATS